MRLPNAVQTVSRRALPVLLVAQILLPPYEISVEYDACLFWERLCMHEDVACPTMHCEIDETGNVVWPLYETIVLPPRETQ